MRRTVYQFRFDKELDRWVLKCGGMIVDVQTDNESTSKFLKFCKSAARGKWKRFGVIAQIQHYAKKTMKITREWTYGRDPKHTKG